MLPQSAYLLFADRLLANAPAIIILVEIIPNDHPVVSVPKQCANIVAPRAQLGLCRPSDPTTILDDVALKKRKESYKRLTDGTNTQKVGHMAPNPKIYKSIIALKRR